VGGEHGATLSCRQGRGDDAAHRIRCLWQSNHVALFTLHRINGTITPPSIDDQRAGAFRSLQQIGYIPAVHPTVLSPPCAHVLWVPQNLPCVTYMCARGGIVCTIVLRTVADCLISFLTLNSTRLASYFIVIINS
jgi:hypothetical protein